MAVVVVYVIFIFTMILSYKFYNLNVHILWEKLFF